MRLVATTASGYRDVTPDGLFQFGHSKGHRPDLPYFKVLLAVLDPLGLPLATDVVSGERADDRLSLPAVAHVRAGAGVGRAGLLYMGDCKMASLETRAGIAGSGAYHLCPLPAGQVPAPLLGAWLARVRRGEQTLETGWRQWADGAVVAIAEGTEWSEERTAGTAEAVVAWTARRLLVQSLAHAQAAETALRARVTKAQAALVALAERVATPSRRGRGRPAANADPRQAASAILAPSHVADVLHVTWTERRPERTVPAAGGRLATVCDPTAPPIRTLTVTLDQEALAAAVARLGWRVYVTNQPATQLPLAQAVLAYRDGYLVERSLGRLKGQPLSLTPMYRWRDDHATGLVRLLSHGLRVLTLLEGTVRRHLATPDEAPLAGLYPGKPTRTTR